MNLAIEIYILFSFSLLFFNIVFVLIKGLETYKVETSRKTGSLKHVKNLVRLTNKQSRRREILEQIDKYSKKSDYKKAYYMYTLSEIEIGEIDEQFKEKIIKFLDTKSIYVFINTMKAVYKIGDTETLLKAMQKIELRFYHTKLLTDGLCEFKNENLIMMLSENFEYFSDEIKIAVLDFCRIKEKEMKISELNILNNSNIEVKYAYLRYKKVGNSDLVYEKILEDSESNWVEKMIAIRGLKDTKSIEKYAKMYVANPNFNLRRESVEKLKDDKEILLNVMKKGDKYTNEAILYTLQKSQIKERCM